MAEQCFEDIDQDCDACFEITRSDCENITIQAGLTPSDTYWLWMVAPDGNMYKNQVTIAGDGSFLITITDYPAGIFTPYSGFFEFFLSDSQNNANYQDFTISATTYNCLIINWTTTCCEEGYTPPSTCDKLKDSLTETEKNECILPSYDFSDAIKVQPNVTAQQQADLITWLQAATEILFTFDATSTDVIEVISVPATGAGTFVAEALTNVDIVKYEVDTGTGYSTVSLPFSLSTGNSIRVTITRSTTGVASMVQINT